MKTYLSPKNFIVGCMAVSAVVISSQASASGYAIREVSPTLMGNAYAGISTSNEDISSIAFNPATLAMIEENAIYISGTGIFPGIDANNVSGTVNVFTPPPLPPVISTPVEGHHSAGGVGKDAFVPAAFFGLDLSERVKLGLAVTSPFGLATKYDDDWVGRDFAVDSRLTSVNLAPMASFSFNEHLSVAAGFQAQYLDAKLSSVTSVPFEAGVIPPGIPVFGLNDVRNQVEGYGWGYGYTLGALYEFTERTRVGAGFQSKMDTTINGTASASASPEALAANPGVPGVVLASSGSAKTHITTPENINFGVSHDFNRHWTVMAEAQWTRWSRFQELAVDINSSVGETTSTVEENWDDSWFYALGATFRPDKKWTLRTGIAYDQTPVDDDFRNPTLPDSDRLTLAVGAGYNFAPCLRLDVGYSHLFFRGAEVDLNDVEAIPGETSKSMSADYNGHADIVSLGLSWEF
jgi:long-chain fatty acid transport protein